MKMKIKLPFLLVILIVFAAITFMFVEHNNLQKVDREVHREIDREVHRETLKESDYILEMHLSNYYNSSEKIFYLIDTYNYASKRFGRIQVPWGINKSEVAVLMSGGVRKLFDERDDSLIYESNEGYYYCGDFVEFHFNKHEQLYKVVIASSLKYIHVEHSCYVAYQYCIQQQGREYSQESYGLYDILFYVKRYKIEPTNFMLSWVDEHGNERTAIIDAYTDPVPRFINDTANFLEMIIENNIVITRYEKKENVSFTHITREFSDGIVLGEAIFINTLLGDENAIEWNAALYDDVVPDTWWDEPSDDAVVSQDENAIEWNAAFDDAVVSDTWHRSPLVLEYFVESETHVSDSEPITFFLEPFSSTQSNDEFSNQELELGTLYPNKYIPCNDEFSNQELELGTYIPKKYIPFTKPSAKLIIQSNNNFKLHGPEVVSAAPSGIYRVENEMLILGDGEFVFLIEDDKLVFESGEWLENWVRRGTKFYLINE